MLDKRSMRSYLEGELLNYTKYKEILKNDMHLRPLAMDRLERTVEAVEYSIKCLSPEELMVFKELYLNLRADALTICSDIGLSFTSYRRYREKIIWTFGEQLGFYCSNSTKEAVTSLFV